MGQVHVWFLCGVLSVLTERGKQDAQPLTAPELLNVYKDFDKDDLGVNMLNVEWKHGFTNSIRPDKVTYDIRIFYTQQMKLVHNETVELNANQMGDYKWSWKSPIPLQCTSHTVQLRYRDHDQTSAWTPLKTLPGNDTSDIQQAKVYPQNVNALVSEGIRFCCILKPEHNGEFRSSVPFPIRISNRTYVTEPIRESSPSPSDGIDILCDGIGSTYYAGYLPDVHNITCETRNLHTVECRWIEGDIFKTTKYSVNGRNCTSGVCVLTMTVGVTNWTLTAENKFGRKIIFDTADPKHRVHLEAPALEPPAQLTARNATLCWKWYKSLNDKSFSMICQVEVNGHIINETFKGRNLNSVVLSDLPPFTQCSARVRCGSHEHFYKWGDWSNLITFITKEDIPEAVDVWMQVFNEQTYIVWNSLSAAQSHGQIIGYELVIGSSTERNKKRISKSQEELCHNLQSGIAKTQVINISARNSAGASPPSSITIPIMSLGGDVDTSDIKGNNGSFDMVWEPSPKSTCGYVLDWYPTYQASQCAIKWLKVSSSVSNKTIYSDFIDGVKYTLSVYACTSGAPYLLQRREGYMVELPPSGTVQNLKAKQDGLNIYLSWTNVPEQEQSGFIEGYKVFYLGASGEEGKFTLDTNTTEHKFSLPVDKYTFTVKAFTSAGDGPGTDYTLHMDPQVGLVIGVCLAVMICVLCIVTLLAYRNWKWLKSALWPEVPKPRLSDEFLKKNVYQWQVLDQLLYEESKVLKIKSSELCPVLLVPELHKDRYEALALNSPHSKDSSWSEDYQTLKSNPQTCPLIDIDFDYQELPGIQNPTYNLPLTHAVSKINQESDYRPQTENCSIQQRPGNAYQWYHTPSNMSKLHFKDKFSI